jgi:hypothetical protein
MFYSLGLQIAILNLKIFTINVHILFLFSGKKPHRFLVPHEGVHAFAVCLH